MMIDRTVDAGRLLVAAPSLADPNFAHAVVLLIDHGEDGAVGVVLNRPSDVAVATILPAWARRAVAPEVVFVGGPVQPDALIGLGHLDVAAGSDPRILPGLCPLDLSREPTEQPTDAAAVRLFAGYAGWSPGQLESEVAAGGWFVLDAAAEDAFTVDPGGLWRSVLVRQGGVYTTVPDDPTAN